MATLVQTTPYNKGGLSDVRAYFNDNLKIVPMTVVPSASYATNGDTIVLPTGVKDWLPTGPSGFVVPINAPLGPYVFVLDTVNSKMKVYTAATMVEVSNATNIQTLLGSVAITLIFLVR